MEKERELIKKLEMMFSAESSGHDISHLVRTYNIAKHLQKKEGGNESVILFSALLHDVHRLIQKETNKFCHPKDSLDTISQILRELKVEDKVRQQVQHCIEFHEEYGFSETGKTVDDIETQILQDADNLDAIGAIGIARAFAFGGANGIPIWVEDIPLGKDHFDESETDPSEIHHFYSKLLKLKENMNTDTAKKMAEERSKFMELYLDHFFKEWSGNL